MACWIGMNSWRGSLSALRRYGQEKMNSWKCFYPCCCGWEISAWLPSGECWLLLLSVPFLSTKEWWVILYQERYGAFLWEPFLARARIPFSVLLFSVPFSFTLFPCSGLGNPCPCHSCRSWSHCAPLHGNSFSLFLLQQILGRPLKPWEDWVWVHFGTWSHCHRAFKGFFWCLVASEWLMMLRSFL